MPISERTIDLGLKDLRGTPGDHVAYFWETKEEFEAATGFLAYGIANGDHVVVFGHDEANAQVLKVLGRRGVDHHRLQSEGRLSVLGPRGTGEEMLASIGKTFQDALDSGATMIRLLGNIGWGRESWPDEEDILRFEAKVTAAAEGLPCIVVCMYDIKSLSGSVILHGALGTHPLTIYQNVIRENPMCVNVDEYLERLKSRTSEREGEKGTPPQVES